jgi:hypothetical protein
MADDKNVAEGDYGSMVWVTDREGKEYACYLKDIKALKPKDKLTDAEKAKCVDVSTVIGNW